MISVVIPALDAASDLAACLEGVAAGKALVREVIVADGGSTDDTCPLATRAGAKVIRSARGRGVQLRQGAGNARAPWMLFLHADTVLDMDWPHAAQPFINDEANVMRAAAFRFVVNDKSAAARRLERIVAWRTRVLSLPYGDQGLLISRAFYDAIGGYAPIPLMEDVDIIRRIGRHRLACLDCAANTSAAKYLRDGWRLRSARNLGCLGLYYCGLPPRYIEPLYR